MDLPLPEDMPEELKTLLREVTGVRFNLELGLYETSMIAQGLDLMVKKLTDAMEGSPPEKVTLLSHLVGDVVILKNRLSTAANAALAEKGGGIEL